MDPDWIGDHICQVFDFRYFAHLSWNPWSKPSNRPTEASCLPDGWLICYPEFFSSTSGAPIYPYVQDVTAGHINVFNEQHKVMMAKVSSGGSHGSELFYAVESGKAVQPNPWGRYEPEVIYVNGPTGTAVGTYYGKNGYTLNVNSQMYVWSRADPLTDNLICS